jgi:F0F1-type ATP synthase membrane subunit c/vacuolar-type H+-ATPase subunit K
VLGLQVAVALFGIYESLFLPTSFWSDTVGAGTFMLDIKGLLEGQNVIDGLPANMFRFGVRRAISTYGDPLALGIASVFPLLLCVAWLVRDRAAIQVEKGRWRWKLALAVIAAGLVLTIGRESIGAAALGAALVVWWSGKSSRLVAPALLLFLLLAVTPQVWSYVVRTVTFKEESAATHLNLFLSGWQHLAVLLPGKGLGEAGGWAFSLAGVQPEVAESSYYELMAQTGALSALLLLGFLFSMVRAAAQHSRRLPDPLLSAAFLAAAAHILARSLSAVFSPSLFGVIPLASFFFLCGALFSVMERVPRAPALAARRVLVLRCADGPTPTAVPL